jgi:hypothetical protein
VWGWVGLFQLIYLVNIFMGLLCKLLWKSGPCQKQKKNNNKKEKSETDCCGYGIKRTCSRSGSGSSTNSPRAPLGPTAKPHIIIIICNSALITVPRVHILNILPAFYNSSTYFDFFFLLKVRFSVPLFHCQITLVQLHELKSKTHKFKNDLAVCKVENELNLSELTSSSNSTHENAS